MISYGKPLFPLFSEVSCGGPGVDIMSALLLGKARAYFSREDNKKRKQKTKQQKIKRRRGDLTVKRTLSSMKYHLCPSYPTHLSVHFCF